MAVKKVLKTENIIKISPEENLTASLLKLKSSHDAAFVFNEKKEFLGVINPYYCIIKSSYPANTKVKHCLHHPPRLHLDDSLIKTAQNFIETKVHYLPVFDEKERFVGIVSARRLLSYFLNDKEFNIKIKDFIKLKKRPLTTVDQNERIDNILNIFKKTKYSKLVVVDSNNKLKGVLSYFDLISYLMTPKDRQNFGSRNGTKTSFYYLQAKHFMKRYVLTLNEEEFLTSVIKLILEKKIGSVVIVDKERKPLQIITTRDILKFFINKEKAKQKPRFLSRFFSSFGV
ncbi:MAG: CBS domain-containing protein [Microgenomates group bacterium]